MDRPGQKNHGDFWCYPMMSLKIDIYNHFISPMNSGFVTPINIAKVILVGGLEHFLFFHILGMSSSLTDELNSYFSEG